MTDGITDHRRRAARIAAHAELLEIRAFSFQADLDDLSAEPPYEVEMKVSPSYDINPYGGQDDRPERWFAVYFHTYELEVQASGTTAATIQCTYGAAYGIELAERPSDDELVAFGETTVSLALYPYIRQFVQDTTARFNLLPIVMPIYREPIKVAAGKSATKTAKTVSRPRTSVAKMKAAGTTRGSVKGRKKAQPG